VLQYKVEAQEWTCLAESELQWNLQLMSNIQPVALINPPQAIFPRTTVTSDAAALQLMLNDEFYDEFGAHEALFAVHDFC
jgi:hypothetical protein